MNQIQFSAEIEDVKARKDRTLSIKISTQELSSEDMGMIFDMFGKQVWCGMSETAIQKLDVPDELPEFAGEKSPSKRLKDRMFVYYTKTYSDNGFNRWYENALEEIGNKYLEKLS